MLVRRLLLAVPVLALVAACGGQAGDTAASAPEGVESPSPGGSGAGGGFTVVTTVFPLADMARRVAPAADVTLLTASGQDPHDLELTPQDRALLESADVVLYLGDLDFQPQVESAVEAATGDVVAVADVVGPDALRSLAGHDHAHDEEQHDDHADVAAGVDPHVWFDAAAMAEVAEAIGEAVAAVDEADAEAARERATALHDELLGLDAEIDDLLTGCSRSYAIVSHEAYAYLLEPRGLEQEGISGAGGHGDASPQRLAELTERIRAEGIPAVLVEPVEGRADAEALAAEAGVDLLEIDPLEIGTEELLALGYPAALRQQAETFAEALGCS